ESFRFEVSHSQQFERSAVPRIERQCLLGVALGGGSVTSAIRAPAFRHQLVGILEIPLAPLLSLAKLQFPAPFLLLLLLVQANFFALVFTTTGVPRKPNLLRIWLIRYRSCEKCSAPELLVKNTNVGGRTDACVT